jgi:Fe-S-cluster containining protein
VWVTDEEIQRLAEFRGETVEEFTARFVRRVGDRYSLIEKAGGDCIFWAKESGCTVYSARPDQCRAWPFWPENVKKRQDWDRVCEVCPGAGHGRLYSLTEIRSSLALVRK